MENSHFAVLRVTAPVRQQVEDGLRTMIAEGRLVPGQRLIERDLCERLGISRPVLREALRQLEAEGLITNLPTRGVIVSRLTVEEAREIYQVRASLEGMAAQSFAATGSDAAVALLGERTASVEAALAVSDGSGLRQAKNAFYETLVDGCGNRVLGQMLRLLHMRIQLLRTTMLSEPGRMQEATTEIRAIFDAIAARQPVGAQAASVLHIRNAERAMERAFAEAARCDAEEALDKRIRSGSAEGG